MHSLRRCARGARGKSRNQANGLTSCRSSGGNRGADCDRNIARSFAGPPPANRNKHEWRERAALVRIAAPQAGLNTLRRCCPDDRSTWRYESVDLRGRRSLRQYLLALDCPGTLHRRRRPNATCAVVKMREKCNSVKTFG